MNKSAAQLADEHHASEGKDEHGQQHLLKKALLMLRETQLAKVRVGDLRERCRQAYLYLSNPDLLDVRCML